MKNLYLRIYVTVVAVLLLFALVAGWFFETHVERERELVRVRVQAQWRQRATAFAALIENSLPRADTSADEQRIALLDWSRRLRLPLALDDKEGQRVATSDLFAQREGEHGELPTEAVRLLLSDGRTLWLWRPIGGGGHLHGPGDEPGRPGDAGGPPGEEGMGPWAAGGLFGRPPLPPGGGIGLLVGLVVLFLAIALGAYPVVRRLTRRLEALQRGVEAFGAGQLSHRVDTSGRDEVAALAMSFNDAAARIELLIGSHRSLLANASHELRSPLARMKMAVAMLEDSQGVARERLKAEIEHDIRELDALVEEVLLSSRLDAQPELDPMERVDLLPLAAEEASRVQAAAGGDEVTVPGSERLLRRAVRNLLENARRYGGGVPPEVSVATRPQHAEVVVQDRGPGVPEAERERIFEPFYRMPGHAEQAGGVGLGLSLVRQIARRHGGAVRCEPREGGGSRFVLTLPRQA